jgi:hypothetical protein
MKRKFSWRSFVSFGLFFSFFIILFSGIILFIAPAGRVANWTNWKLFGLTKIGWQSMHTVFAYTFVVLSIFHLFSINWRVFWSYIRMKAGNGLNKTKELVAATLFTLLIFFGIVYKIPPFQTIMDWGEQFTEGWEKEETEPPIPHAESYSLDRFAGDILHIPVDTAMQRLADNNIVVTGTEETIAEISAANNLSPQDLYKIFGSTDEEATKLFTTDKIIQGGNGIGRKTLEQIGEEYGIPVESLVQALRSAGINDVSGGSVLKDIADNTHMTPAEILEILNQRNE